MKEVLLKNYILAIESGTRGKGGATAFGVPSLGAEHLNADGTISWDKNKMKYIPVELFKNLKSGIVHNNDVLIVKDGATTGKVAYVEKIPYSNVAINEHVFLLRPKSEILPKYLFYYLMSANGNKKIMSNFRGATVGGIGKNFIEMPINLISIDVQQHVVNVLDKISHIITLRKKQLKNFDELVKSRFIEMFGEPDKNTFNWSKEKLGEHLDVVNGFAFKSEGFTDIGIPVLRIGNINSGTFKATNMVFWPNDATLFRYKIYPGDLVISLTGTVGKDDYGNVCILGTEYKEYYLNQRNAKLDIKNTINKYYLSQILKFNEIKNQLTGISRGVRQANISIKDILSLSVPIPPIELQDKFADFVKQTDKSKLEIQKSIDKLEILKKSLMQQYFG